MKKQFKITGFYYTEQEFKFRKYLDIKNIGSSLTTPDLMVIMMNPGGSKPIDGVDNGCIDTLAVPDRTQDQIMQVMLNCGFGFARVLNLSDLREPKSSTFYKQIPELDSKGIPHSIFDENRQFDFDQLWVKNVPVIYGWGVNYHLKPLALKAIAASSGSNTYGILKLGKESAYYHPLPRTSGKQLEWVKELTVQLTS
ncbi:DUF1643 domain-containing protein [Polaribacter sp. 20A6]|uniref:DUF1643 domain-containing protein n=1 Tax=Polaribacter sp. 20A6 TaxID=2687289 RepID=UPI0013FE23FD|nr:DUF1643 domain-containing protein [Polaribacter sp. 20A6]